MAVAMLDEHRVRAAQASGGSSSEPVYAAVLQELSRLPGGAVLDFGAGTGCLTRRLLDAGRYRSVTGADIMPHPPSLHEDADWIRQDLNAPLARHRDLGHRRSRHEHREQPSTATPTGEVRP